MRFLPARMAFLVAGLLGACTPTYNWREIRFDGTPLVALLPCKPDEGRRPAALGGASGAEPVVITMKGCETGGITFAVGWAQTGDAAQAATLLARWKAATLANLAPGTPPRPLPFSPAGAQPLPEPAAVSVSTSQADGVATAARAAWFARGSQVYQALAVGSRIDPQAAETFLSGLRLQ